jgi:hypothetical protein
MRNVNHVGRRAALGAAMMLLMSSTASLAAAPNLVPHRAVYDISLKSAEERSGIDGAQGRMVIEFLGSGCEGWTINFRMINQFFLSGGKSRVLDSRSSMWESGGNDQLRYVQSQYVDSQLQEEKELKAQMKDGEAGGAITKPAPEAFTLPEGVIFPVNHQLRLVQAAMDGKTRDESLLYDGSDGANPAIAISFIGSGKPPAEAEGEKLSGVGGQPSWPVTISYYKPDKKEQETPDYQINMRLYQNGISGDMTLNYSDFSLNAKLADLEVFDQAECKQ